MVTSVQIAAPVSETVNESPVVSFKDDRVLGWIRSLINVTGPTVESLGVTPGDLRGHSLQTYLEHPESREQITRHINGAYARLKYPIPYFESAATIDYVGIIPGKSPPDVQIAFWNGDRDIAWYDEVRSPQGARLERYGARCIDLRVGEVDIRAKSIFQNSKERNVRLTEYVGDPGPSAAKLIQMTNLHEISRWRLGRMHLSPGKGRNPIEVEVNYSDPPDFFK